MGVMKGRGLYVLAVWLVMSGLAFSGLWARIDQFGQVDRAQSADVIVLLGSMVYPGGRVSPSLERRALHAAALYRRGLAPRVLCTGGIGTYAPSEAIVACSRVVELGVPASAIILEDQARNTEQNAAYTARLMRESRWQSAIVVSDGFHLYRATTMFEQQHIITYPSPSEATAGPMNSVERVLRELREAVGVLWYGLRWVLGVAE
jgi:uncharacterized SAM-binding protein YcdF (DUF218 family)